ncbi:uncharacterized protein LOC130050839 [Ostrea edulis]|uniref:uncharacterized protein LOC130050839 n=1 Tax=Ostrea edulis TaxID=37623 RepID=UPI0024AF1C6F|nr:uncharacterized protein LOC130050839 [Ostrea edulis]XP_056007601.1 uncharacterized protein LOC130050839 [Ostrea edulis]
MEHFPLFYKEMLVFFNDCKKNKKQFYLNALLKEPLWCNKNFMYKNKPIFFHNWLRSGFKYLNDTVNENGIKPLEWFDDKLICKKNWMCEYMIIKTVITKTFKSYEFSNIRYENIFHGNTSYDLLCKGHVKVCDINSKLIYEILCHEKFIPPLHQAYYGKVFEITKTAWKSIYEQKILSIRDRSISEFNYKLLNNLLCNRELLKKWKIVENDFCVICRDAKENNEHLILKCKNVSHIWDIVKQILKFDISWKTIVIGFYYENNEKTLFLNSIISLIACKIYKYKMYCRLDNKDEKPQEICNHIKSKLNFYTEVYTKIQDKKYAKVMKAIKDKL